MENPCTIIMFGDSILKSCTDVFRNAIMTRYKEYRPKVINASIDGQTSADGLARIKNILSQRPNVGVVGFGMNDWRKGVDPVSFRKNLIKIIGLLEAQGIRVLLTTIIPDYQGTGKGTSAEISRYNSVIYDVADKKRIRIADVHALWKQEMKPVWMGLSDEFHPNERGRSLICKALMTVVPRRKTTVLWAFDGAAVPCNYRCPYCYDQCLPSRAHRFRGPMKMWHDGFKSAFGNQHLTFYISYGEAMLSKKFYELVEMFASEPTWDMMMTSNLSQSMDTLVKTRLAREGRLNINASFHPTETSLKKFLDKLHFLRDHGIECPVIYVMYPPLMNQFEQIFHVLDEHNFLVHVRAFEGKSNGKTYPRDYSEQERRFVAKYSDDATIKYMLNRPRFWEIGKPSYHGMYYIYVTSEGNVVTQFFGPDEFTPSRYAYGRRLGNILDHTMKLDLWPRPLQHTVERSVTDVASILETGYHELEGNFIMSFAKQGRVYREDGSAHYPHLNADFSDKRLRKKYNFDSRASTLQDSFCLFKNALSPKSPYLRKYMAKKIRLKLYRSL